MNKHVICLANNLKDLMENLTVSQLARETGIPQPTLSRYLLCQREITLTNLVILADFFEVEIDVLIGRMDY